MRHLYHDWNKEYQLPNSTLKIIKGQSIGSIRSCFYIPHLKLMLDAGMSSPFSPRHIFVTHCHTDHSFSLPMIISGLDYSPNIYVPKENQTLFDNFIQSTQLLNSNGTYHTGVKCIGVEEGDIVSIKKNTHVEIFNMSHVVPCRGYGIYTVKNKLRREYAELSRIEIRNLIRNGDIQSTDIREQIRMNELMYFGDTSIQGVNNFVEYCVTQQIYYSNIMIECTFLGDRTAEGHLEFSDIINFAERMPMSNIILTHCSARYIIDIIREYASLLPTNTHFWELI